MNAITLAGGSSYGLSVATGVANALKERTVDAGNWDNIPTVPGAIIFDLAAVWRQGEQMSSTVTGADSQYLPAGKNVRLVPVGQDEFEPQTGRADVIHFDRDERSEVRGFILNPGPWPIAARRLTE